MKESSKLKSLFAKDRGMPKGANYPAMFEKKASYILRKIAMLFHKISRKAPFINSFFKQSCRFPSAILRTFDSTTSVFLAGLGQLSEVCVMLKLFLEIFIL